MTAAAAAVTARMRDALHRTDNRRQATHLVLHGGVGWVKEESSSSGDSWPEWHRRRRHLHAQVTLNVCKLASREHCTSSHRQCYCLHPDGWKLLTCLSSSTERISTSTLVVACAFAVAITKIL